MFQKLLDAIILWVGLEPVPEGPSAKELQRQLTERTSSLELANKRIVSLEAIINKSRREALDAAIASARNADLAVDWGGMRVRSIERLIHNDHQEKTVLGFIDDKGVLSSNWHFYCSIEKHNQLVAEFKEHLKSESKVRVYAGSAQ